VKHQTQEFCKFHKTPKKDQTPRKSSNSQKREESNSWNQERSIPAPWPVLIPKLSMVSMLWNTSIGQLGCLSGYSPSQLLHTCSLAEHEKLEKVPDFIATTENISVIIILLVLKPKHSSYWEEN